MENSIFGGYFQLGFDPRLKEEDFMALAKEFKPYIWGETGICDFLKTLKFEDYGADLELALFQFYVKPTTIERQRLKPIEAYRKSEKSIGIPVIVDDENFFSRSEKDRYGFLKQSILQKMDLLAEVVKKKKLDTKIQLLRSDLEKILMTFNATQA